MRLPSSERLNILGTAFTVLTLITAVATFTAPDALSVPLSFIVLAIQVAAIVCFYLAQRTKTG
jgi:hypothetical protein